MLATVLPSHASDAAARETWPPRDVDAESCWRWRCQGNLVMARCRCRVMLVTMLLSQDGDGATEVTWSRRDVGAESCSQLYC
jgi:hypothetical protein